MRAVSALVLIPLALLSIWYGGLPFASLLALITIGCAHEWSSLLRNRMNWTNLLPFAGPPLATMLAATGATAASLGVLVMALLAGLAVRPTPIGGRFAAFGVLYIGVPAVALVWLREPVTSGMSNVIGILLIVWATDIGAYVVGRAIGGAKLAPAISPGKTWSGAAGGLAAAAIAGLCLAQTLSFRAVFLALVFSAVGQAGDLFESWLKRLCAVKDSGSLIPGHGGLLDRLDAVLAVVPVAALLALILGRGVFLWE